MTSIFNLMMLASRQVSYTLSHIILTLILEECIVWRDMKTQTEFNQLMLQVWLVHSISTL